MAYKINPFHQLLWRTPNTVQIGVGVRRKIIAGISSGQERLIDALYFGIGEAQLGAMAKQARVPLETAKELITELDSVLLKDVVAADNASTDDTQIARSELVRAGLDFDLPGPVVAGKRRDRAVHLDTLDPTGLTLLLALAAAGVGTFTTRDNARVSRDDIASNVYPAALLGQFRHQAARLILDSSWPGARLVYTNRSTDKKTARVDLAVLVHHQVTAPSVVAIWRTMSVPVLEIRYQPDGVEITPVLTENAGCLICRDHYRQDIDDGHLTLSAQLLGSDLRFDDGSSRLVAAGIASQQILDFLDRAEGPAVELAAFRYWRQDSAGRIGGTRLEATEWLPHPQCGCQITAAAVLSEAS